MKIKDMYLVSVFCHSVLYHVGNSSSVSRKDWLFIKLLLQSWSKQKQSHIIHICFCLLPFKFSMGDQRVTVTPISRSDSAFGRNKTFSRLHSASHTLFSHTRVDCWFRLVPRSVTYVLLVLLVKCHNGVNMSRLHGLNIIFEFFLHTMQKVIKTKLTWLFRSLLI